MKAQTRVSNVLPDDKIISIIWSKLKINRYTYITL